MTPPTVPEEISAMLLNQRHFIDDYTCLEEYNYYEAQLLALIAADREQVRREAIEERDFHMRPFLDAQEDQISLLRARLADSELRYSLLLPSPDEETS